MRFVIPLIFGLAGGAVLIGLGLWQLNRLEWKEGVLAEIEARAESAPVPLPDTPTEADHAFLPVALSGDVAGPPFNVFGTWRGAGAGVRLIVPFQTADRQVLLDLGATAWTPGTPVADAAAAAPAIGTTLDVIGNLQWPDGETCDDAPAPGENDWCGRDIAAFARISASEPVLVVARTVSPPTPVVTLPVGTDGIPNNHLGYAIQWFGLAAVWLGMTAFLLWRMRRRT